MAIAGAPRVVLLDEPTSGISIEEKFDVMAVVMAALKDRRITVLFVEHDMDIVERYADRVLAFYDGAVIADGPPVETLENPRIQELISGPKLKPRFVRQPTCLRSRTSTFRSAPSPIIRGASLELDAGEMCGLIGRNGAGKTTLMRALMGALPASGTAELAGIDLLRLPPHARVDPRHRLYAGGPPACSRVHG